jgi:hypothetical protein
VRPGKHLLLFGIDLGWQTATGHETAHAVATQEAEIGVLGLSETLKVLTVPTFLLLPGVLMLVAAALVYGLLKPTGSPAAKDIPFLDAASAAFWVVSITLSIGMAVAYPRLGGHDYLSEYGLGDVIRVWFASIAFGALVALVVVPIWRAHRDAPTFSENDEPKRLIRKMAQRHLAVVRKEYDLDDGGIAFSLGHNHGSEATWLSPRIKLVAWNEKKITEADLRAFVAHNESANELLKLMQKADIEAVFASDRLPSERPWPAEAEELAHPHPDRERVVSVGVP